MAAISALLAGFLAACGGGGSSGGTGVLPPSGPGSTPPPISVPSSTPAPQATLVYTSDQGVILSQPGQTYQFAVGVQFPAGSIMPVTGASWQSLNAAVATVDQTGNVTITGASGSAVIVANYASYDPAYASVIVAHATPQTVLISSSLVKSVTPTSAVLVRNAQTQGLLPGAIVVSGTSGNLFGQVTGVQIDPATITLSLQPTTIPAAFPDYTFVWNGPASQYTVQSKPGGRYTVTNRRGSVVAQGQADLACSVAAVSVKEFPYFTAPISVRPIFLIDLPHGLFQIGAQASGSVSFTGGMYDVAGTIANPVSCAASFKLPQPVQIVGELLSAAPSVSPSVGFEISTSGAVTLVGPTAETSFDVTAGLQYQHGQWTLMRAGGAPALIGTTTPPRFTYDGPIGATLSPFFRVDVGFDICAGVCITTPIIDTTLLNTTVAFVRTYSDFSVSLSGPTNELTRGYKGPTFSTDSGEEAGVELSFDFTALDKLLKRFNIVPLTIPGRTFPLKTDPFVAPSIRIGANLTTVAAGNPITLSASALQRTGSRVRFIGFLNGASTATILASASLDASGNGTATWTAPASATGQYEIVGLLDNAVGLPTASTNSVAVSVSGSEAPPPPPPPSNSPLTVTGVNPPSVSVSTIGAQPEFALTGSNFLNVASVKFTLSGVASGANCTCTWIRAGSDGKFASNVSIDTDSKMRIRPTVVQSNDPPGTTVWTVTLTDTSGTSKSSTFTVVYAPPVAPPPSTPLTLTSVTPPSITVSSIGAQPEFALAGSNFNNVTKVQFALSGAASGANCTCTWIRGGSDGKFASSVSVDTDTKMRIRPIVVQPGDSAGTTVWTVTLTDISGATSFQTFTVIYSPPITPPPSPQLTFTSVMPPSVSVANVGAKPEFSLAGSNFNNVTKVQFTLSGAASSANCTCTWVKGAADGKFASDVSVDNDNTMRIRPIVVSFGDRPGSTIWTVTLTDTTGATKFQTFNVVYTPILSFTNVNPPSVTVRTVGAQPEFALTGANFLNVTTVKFTLSGVASSGACTCTWVKGGSDGKFATNVSVDNDNSMRIRPIVVAANDPTGTTIWTVTLTDTVNANRSQTFTVIYTH